MTSIQSNSIDLIFRSLSEENFGVAKMNDIRATKYFEKIKLCIDTCITIPQLDNTFKMIGRMHLQRNNLYQALLVNRLYEIIMLKGQLIIAKRQLQLLNEQYPASA